MFGHKSDNGWQLGYYTAINLCYWAGFSLRAFKLGSQGLPKRSKGVFDYDSGVCCFKEAETTATILINLAFKPEIR